MPSRSQTCNASRHPFSSRRLRLEQGYLGLPVLGNEMVKLLINVDGGWLDEFWAILVQFRGHGVLALAVVSLL